MSSERDELIDATIAHLTELKRRGGRFVNLEPESISALAQAGSQAAGAGAGGTGAPRTVAPVAAGAARRPPVAGFSGSLSAAVEREIGAPTRAASARLSPAVSAPPPSPSPAMPSSGSPGASADKLEAMRELRERALVCTKCVNLATARTQVVFGVGTVEAELMFVGEAPGVDEDQQGEPFVGAAGQLLTKIIQTMGLSRETVYIANILKCRPDTPGQASGNRKPTADEMKTCIPYLHSQIDIIRPKILVALGATAVEGLLGAVGGISRVRGTWREYRGIPLMPTFHPAYLLRNMALSEKRKVWEDMLQVMERLALPVSEKQRGFFLPKSGTS